MTSAVRAFFSRKCNMNSRGPAQFVARIAIFHFPFFAFRRRQSKAKSKGNRKAQQKQWQIRNCIGVRTRAVAPSIPQPLFFTILHHPHLSSLPDAFVMLSLFHYDDYGG